MSLATEPKLYRPVSFRPPREIWALKRSSGELLVLDADPGMPFLAFTSEEDARGWAVAEDGGLDLEPVRVK